MFCLETSFAAVSGLNSHPGWLGLVVAGRVEAEFADQFAVFLGDDPELKVAGEDEDLGAGPAASDADVVELAVVAQGELAVGVDGVAADTEVLADADALAGGDGPGPGVPGRGGGAPADGPVWSLGVVAGGEGVKLGLQCCDGGGRVLAGQPFLQGLVQPLDFPAGLGMVGPGVAQADAQRGELAFEGDPATAAVKASEYSTIIGEHPFGPTVRGHRQVQVSDDVAGLEDAAGGGSGQQPGVIVEDVEDLGVTAISKRPVGDVGLPDLVRQVCLEPVPGGPGPLVRLRGDETPPGQDPPDGGHRGSRACLLAQVPGNRLRASVQAVPGQIFAQGHDGIFGGLTGALRAGMRAA